MLGPKVMTPGTAPSELEVCVGPELSCLPKLSLVKSMDSGARWPVLKPHLSHLLAVRP